MLRREISTTVFMLCIILHGTEGQCSSKSTCSECVQHTGCAWCKQRGFLSPGQPDHRRCDTAEGLRRRNCSAITDPTPNAQRIMDKGLGSSLENVVQLRPQKIHLKLRVGVPQTFEVAFKRAEGYPIDLYFLMDLSFSMRDDLENVKKLGYKVMSALRNVTHAARIGFGAFVEKRKMPYVNTKADKLAEPCHQHKCQPSFSFQHVLKLTDNMEDFETEVSKQYISTNEDLPESGFDGVMQVAVCEKEIGWGNVTRILVYLSDDLFHMAGDGRLAGIVTPNDGKCHLNRMGFYEKGELHDYPSIAHLSETLTKNHIKIIFAITKKVLESYQALSEVIPQSVVGILESDSSNVVQLISDAYNDLVSKLILEHHKAPAGLDITYSSTCSDGTYSHNQRRGECRNVGFDQQINFTVTVSSSVCFSHTKSFIIKPQGLNEELSMTVETICDCDCSDTEQKSPDCHGNGTYTCGICSCDEGYVGQMCECEKQQNADSILSMDALCSPINSTNMCSGHGSCLCGRCICHGQYRGQYCQCDDTSCNHHKNLICGGNGRCNCGTCECHPNYEGSACECPTTTDECQTGNGSICSNHGHCECNQCVCHPGFKGKHCTVSLYPCLQYGACVRCRLSNVLENRTCDKACTSTELIHSPDARTFSCHEEMVFFNVESNSETVRIFYRENHNLFQSAMFGTLVIVCSGVGGVVILGTTMILTYLLLLNIYYQIVP
ncbi:integrin beta-2-like [Salminus brasiliensis]|uniref:integrin beta-2-like n=1 Tax=Salminus brasiliensis TaxID=930266 RepID=UPI003B82DDA9